MMAAARAAVAGPVRAAQASMRSGVQAAIARCFSGMWAASVVARPLRPLRTLEVYHDGQRVALHVRSGRKGRATTEAAHMPEKHRAMAAWTPERMEAWAARTGPATAALAAAIMASRPHPALGFRSCLGGLRAGARCRGALLRLRALNPRARPRRSAPGRRRRAAAGAAPRQPARCRLLRLTRHP